MNPLSVDGTGEFSSAKACRKHCCRKESQNGSISYYHQILGPCIVHPEKSNVIPFVLKLSKIKMGIQKMTVNVTRLQDSCKIFLESILI